MPLPHRTHSMSNIPQTHSTTQNSMRLKNNNSIQISTFTINPANMWSHQTVTNLILCIAPSFLLTADTNLHVLNFARVHSKLYSV